MQPLAIFMVCQRRARHHLACAIASSRFDCGVIAYDALRYSGLHITRDLETAIGVGALLQDVTHVPFGHTLDDERRLFNRHDEGSRLAQMFSGELGLTLERLGLRDIVGHLLGLPSNEPVNWQEAPNSRPTPLAARLQRSWALSSMKKNGIIPSVH